MILSLTPHVRCLIQLLWLKPLRPNITGIGPPSEEAHQHPLRAARGAERPLAFLGAQLQQPVQGRADPHLAKYAELLALS